MELSYAQFLKPKEDSDDEIAMAEVEQDKEEELLFKELVNIISFPEELSLDEVSLHLNKKNIESDLEKQQSSENLWKNLCQSMVYMNPMAVEPNKGHKIRRQGDWVCWSCKNLNFAFRNECNICKISKEWSEKLKELYLSLKAMHL